MYFLKLNIGFFFHTVYCDHGFSSLISHVLPPPDHYSFTPSFSLSPTLKTKQTNLKNKTKQNQIGQNKQKKKKKQQEKHIYTQIIPAQKIHKNIKLETILYKQKTRERERERETKQSIMRQKKLSLPKYHWVCFELAIFWWPWSLPLSMVCISLRLHWRKLNSPLQVIVSWR